MREQPSHRLIAAGAILAAYFVVAGILLTMLVSGDRWEWSQILVIFNAVGALATAAAGVLFGAEIQQANVRNAQQVSQAHAAASARKDQAMLEALASLDSASEGAANARSILRHAVAAARPPGS